MNFCSYSGVGGGNFPDEPIQTLNKHYDLVDEKTEFALETLLRLSNVIEERRRQSLQAITRFKSKQKIRLRSIERASHPGDGKTPKVRYVLDWSGMAKKGTLPRIAKCEMPTPLGKLGPIKYAQKSVRDSLGVVINSSSFDMTRMVLNQNERMMAVLLSEQSIISAFVF